MLLGSLTTARNVTGWLVQKVPPAGSTIATVGRSLRMVMFTLALALCPLEVAVAVMRWLPRFNVLTVSEAPLPRLPFRLLLQLTLGVPLVSGS